MLPSDFPFLAFWGMALLLSWATKLKMVSLLGLAGMVADIHEYIFSSVRNPRAGGLGTGEEWCSEDRY